MKSSKLPHVSIIMPAYNSADFIGAAIQSVLRQTMSDWELIIVNDGSTDNTAAVLETIKDPRITVITQCNQGQAVARNVGLNIAKGKYQAFLDADDLYLPDALAVLSEYLELHPGVDVVYSDGYFCNEQAAPLMKLSEHRPVTPIGDILESVVTTPSIIIAIHCAMTRRKVIECSRLQFDRNLTPSEDWDFWIQLARYAQFGYLDKPTCVYRVHETNITKATPSKNRREDLVQGRLKTMQSDWFQDLSTPTKQQFFYNLIIQLLSDNLPEQKKILQSPSFLQLPDIQQAILLRHIATDYLLKHSNIEFTHTCLEQATIVAPQDRISRILLKLMDINYTLCIQVVAIRRVLQTIFIRLRTLGKKTPKPVPTALRLSE
jgi:glycosyltransferase involved in cell wall biosynthesis